MRRPPARRPAPGPSLRSIFWKTGKLPVANAGWLCWRAGGLRSRARCTEAREPAAQSPRGRLPASSPQKRATSPRSPHPRTYTGFDTFGVLPAPAQWARPPWPRPRRRRHRRPGRQHRPLPAQNLRPPPPPPPPRPPRAEPTFSKTATKKPPCPRSAGGGGTAAARAPSDRPARRREHRLLNRLLGGLRHVLPGAECGRSSAPARRGHARSPAPRTAARRRLPPSLALASALVSALVSALASALASASPPPSRRPPRPRRRPRRAARRRPPREGRKRTPCAARRGAATTASLIGLSEQVE